MGHLIQQILPLEDDKRRHPLPPDVEVKVVIAMADLLLAVLAVEEKGGDQSHVR